MISNMYSYFFVHTLHCMGSSVSSRKGGAREDDETVSTGCDAAVTYARFSGGPFVLSRGGDHVFVIRYVHLGLMLHLLLFNESLLHY